MARPKDPSRALERRQHIIDAASECFRMHGFHQTSMASICAAAGMSPGALYRYFPSKDALIIAIMERHVDAGHDAGGALDGTIAALRGFARRIMGVDGDSEQLRLSTEICTEASRRPEFARRLESVRLIVERSVQTIVRNGQASGNFAAGIDPVMAATSLVCLLDGLIFRITCPMGTPFTSTYAVDIFEQTARAMLMSFGEDRAARPASSNAPAGIMRAEVM